MRNSLISTAIAFALSSALGFVSAANAADEPMSQDNYITGSLVIDWNTRLPQNRDGDYPKTGVTDTYDMDVTVGHTFYKGKINCLPYIFSKHIGRVLQEGTCEYDLDVGVINPANTSQKRVVGKLAGQRPMNREGHMDLSASNLRMEVQTIGRATGFISKYAGTVIASPVKAKTTLSEMMEEATKQTATITRMVSGEEVSLTLGDVDPVTFQGVTLPAGPSSNYSEAAINGRFVYSYETDNWFPTLQATYGGMTDRISGGMKWVDDSESTGHYELNILFNEDKAAQSEASAFSEAQGEDAFFMADPAKSTVNGTISFKDTRIPEVEDPVKSEVDYNVGLQMVTAQQAQVLWKALLLIPNQLYGE